MDLTLAGSHDTPTVSHIQLPTLPGLTAASVGRMIFGTAKNMVRMPGAGSYGLSNALPPGTPHSSTAWWPHSGQLRLSCAEFQTQPEARNRGRLQLTQQLSRHAETVTTLSSATLMAVRPGPPPPGIIANSPGGAAGPGRTGGPIADTRRRHVATSCSRTNCH